MNFFVSVPSHNEKLDVSLLKGVDNSDDAKEHFVKASRNRLFRG